MVGGGLILDERLMVWGAREYPYEDLYNEAGERDHYAVSRGYKLKTKEKRVVSLSGANGEIDIPDRLLDQRGKLVDECLAVVEAEDMCFMANYGMLGSSHVVLCSNRKTAKVVWAKDACGCIIGGGGSGAFSGWADLSIDVRAVTVSVVRMERHCFHSRPATATNSLHGAWGADVRSHLPSLPQSKRNQGHRE